MTNVTFKAEEPLIRKARLRAKTENRSLNDVFVDWLKVYAGQNQTTDYYEIKKKFSHIKSGRKFTRDEMNER
ncbi:MAG: antitoxin [Spirochaetes bacterium]|nr:antitoxin [Spirochaetota bacterium]